MAAFLLILSYLIGSLSFSYFISKAVKGVDIRDVGSGNAGATNVARVLGLKYAVLVLILDALKGLVVVLLASHLHVETWLLLFSAGAVIAGHNWPLFFGFKGGRGVATTFGVFLGIAPIPALVIFLLFIIIILWTRYVSLASIVGALSIPVVMLLLPYPPSYFVFGLAVCLLLLGRHMPNIKRLLQGKESKLGEKVNIKKTER
ncbi:MAG: glycerol-3-phosphate 1-O-acyltransferase PlsY [Firmicutes bacterium]|nr:glycerol-3-phosphate 1-O-acyltransferase PlsY [Bacillota bacterium]